METKPLKTAKFWKLVVINYISSFFVGGILAMVVLYGYASASGMDLTAGDMPDPLIAAVISIAALCLTTWNAARYLKRHYVIPNPKKLVLWTVGVFVVLTAAGLVFDSMDSGFMPDMVTLISDAVSLVAFYVLSSKFLKA